MKFGASRKKKWFRVLGLGCLVIVVIALALPVWSPWVLRPVLAHFGVRFGLYERVGYTRFRLTDVRGDFPTARFQSERIAGFLPPRWLWRRYFRGSVEEPFLTVAHWGLQIEPAGKPRQKGASTFPDSAFALAEQISGRLPAWRTWLPMAQLTEGRVQVGSKQVMVAAAEWHRGKLTAKVESSKPMETFLLNGDFSDAPPYAINLDAESSGLTCRVRLSRAAGQWQASGEMNWKSNRVELEAVFGHEGWRPKRAGLKSDHFRVPAKLLRLDGYEDPTGAFAVDLVGGRFHLEASAHAPAKNTDAAFTPPLDLDLLARGDLDSVVLEKLRITSPVIQADLSNPIGLNRSGKLTTEAATLRVALDLARLTGSSIGGRLSGEVSVRPMPAGYPTAAFELSGEEVAGRGLPPARVRLGGRLRWPILSLRSAEIEFADGSTLGCAGEINLKSRQVSGGKWHFQGALARRFLPRGITCSTLHAAGQISGPLGALIHSGELTAEDASAPHLKPCRVLATWRGEHLAFPEMNLKLSSGTSALELAGAVRVGGPAGPSCDIDLRTLTLTRDGDALFWLENPCRIVARRESSGAALAAPAIVGLKVDDFQWGGPDGGLIIRGDVEWPRRGKVEISGHGLSLADLGEFVSVPVEGVSLTAVDLKGQWAGGPIEFQLSAKGELPVLEGRTFSAHVKLKGDAEGLVADPLIVSAEGAEIVHAQGRLPLLLTPEPGNVRVQWERQKPFDFQAVTEPNEEFWNFASQHLGVRIADPKVEAHLQGTLQEVRGTLRAQASRIGRANSDNKAKLPPIEKLRIEARFERDLFRLSELTFETENQPVRVTGEVPIRQNFLLDFFTSGALPDWRQARARLEITDVRIESFAGYLPRALSPQGELSISLGVVPGGELNGELTITGAATRPIPPLAPIRDIQARVLFAGRRATIHQFTARMGGREVTVTGQFEWPESGGAQFDLRLRGDNVPLVYRPGLLLRSDFDIQLSQAGGQPATLSGDVALRDGLYLQDLKALVPTGGAEPLGRPPYFSVAEKPFADWKLELKVHGDRFMRVRTPYFRGEVSADFQIMGNFEEPLALGEARINSGLVRFPFGTLNIVSPSTVSTLRFSLFTSTTLSTRP